MSSDYETCLKETEFVSRFNDDIKCDSCLMPSMVNEIREEFFDHFETNKYLYDDEDVMKLHKDWYVERYLLANNYDSSQTLESIKNCFQWRKSIQLSKLTETSFPAEFFKTGGLFVYETNRDGNPMIYMRVKMIRKIPELDDALKTFLAFQVEKIDQMADKLLGWGLVFDCTDAGYVNIHLNMLRYLISMLNNYFPFGLSQIIVCEVPWILNAIQKVIVSMLPDEAKKLVLFRTKKNVDELIAKENLPDYLGGTCNLDYRRVPDGCKDVETIAVEEFGWKIEKIKKIKKYFNEYLTDD